MWLIMLLGVLVWERLDFSGLRVSAAFFFLSWRCGSPFYLYFVAEKSRPFQVQNHQTLVEPFQPKNWLKSKCYPAGNLPEGPDLITELRNLLVPFFGTIFWLERDEWDRTPLNFMLSSSIVCGLTYMSCCDSDSVWSWCLEDSTVCLVICVGSLPKVVRCCVYSKIRILDQSISRVMSVLEFNS